MTMRKTTYIALMLFSISLLAGCTLRNNNSVNKEKKVYENKKYGFKFEYPSNWKIEEKMIDEEDNNGIELEFHNNCIKNCRILNINIMSTEPFLIDFSDHDMLSQTFDYENYKTKSKISSISIDNVETFERKATKDTSYCKFFELYCEYSYLVELLTRNNNYYYRFAFAGNFAKDGTISIEGTEFEGILSSFKFIK
jgi:hypothetical protein